MKHKLPQAKKIAIGAKRLTIMKRCGTREMAVFFTWTNWIYLTLQYHAKIVRQYLSALKMGLWPICILLKRKFAYEGRILD